MTPLPRFRIVMTCAVLHATAAAAAAQDVTTLGLAELHDSAEASAPRARQAALLARQSELRRRNIAGELLPAIALEGQAQYQSDVAHVPVPGAPTPPHDTYDARLAFTQRILDPTLGPRRRVERAQLERSQADVRSALYTTRQQVNDAYFAVLRAQVQADELRAAMSAIEAQVEVAATRVREGAALRSEALTLEAELLRRRQLLADMDIVRRAALATLAQVTGIAVDSTTRLAVPELERAVQRAREAADAVATRARPEYAQFDASRALLREQESARAAQDLPRASAFGRAGYGQPGLNPLNDSFDSYWLVGIQVQWTPLTWGATRRDREVLAVQREIVASEEQAFTEQLRRLAIQERAAVERLGNAVRLDEEIIAAREQIAAEARARFAEAVITSAEYVERQTELLGARLTRALHHVELAEARARLLTTLGLEVEQ